MLLMKCLIAFLILDDVSNIPNILNIPNEGYVPLPLPLKQ